MRIVATSFLSLLIGLGGGGLGGEQVDCGIDVNGGVVSDDAGVLLFTEIEERDGTTASRETEGGDEDSVGIIGGGALLDLMPGLVPRIRSSGGVEAS